MLGIGLGGFMEGYNKAQDMKLDREKADLVKQRYERQKVLDEREDAAFARTEKQRTAIEDAVTKSQNEFEAAVDSGTAKPEDSDDWFAKHTVPVLKNTYLANGDVDNADKVQKWADTADAKTGAKLFKSAMLKAQTGDGAGALDDAIKAGQTQGYIAHGYEVQKHDKIVKPDGTLMGYRVWLKDPDGKEITQDIQTSELQKTIATFLNPEAAWESQVTASQAETKRQQELADYRTKKQIDKEVGLGDEKLRGDAITNLRKRLDGGLAGDEQKFDDLPADQKEKLIAEELQLQRGGSGTPSPTRAAPVAPGLAAGGTADAPAQDSSPAAPSGRKAIVDTVTGQRVATRPVQGPNKPPEKDTSEPGIIDRIGQGVIREMNILSGRQEAPKREDPRAAEAPRGGKDRSRKSDGLRRQENMEYQVAAADAAAREGVPVDRIVQELLANGISEEQWPASVKQAIVNKRSGGVIGLGR
ncbi:hypothetical protein [Sinorhizobium chiapasense]|uniref:Uncharacterized protein n=1 Tax=Sinorhizobium chiapasense TaxID=501572 RepID=A0ABZ2BER8_9HYPH